MKINMEEEITKRVELEEEVKWLKRKLEDVEKGKKNEGRGLKSRGSREKD